MHENTPPNLPPTPPILQPVYTGKAGELFSITITNALLWILTLGTHRFWGRTRMRRYLWSHMQFLDEPAVYLGTGKELFKGFCKFAFLFVFPSVIAGLISTVFLHNTPYQPVERVINGFVTINFIIVVMFARFWGLRYRLSRTSWRGIRIELRGRSRDYVALQIKNFILNVLSLWLYKPMGDVAVLNFLVNRIYFGDQPITYRGQREELQKHYYICWLLLLPTLGLSLIWYKAKYFSHMAKYIRVGAMEFRCKIAGGELLTFLVINWLLIIGTLGFGYFYSVHRRMRFFAQRLKFRGTLDFEKIGQAGKRAGSEGAESYFGGDDLGF